MRVRKGIPLNEGKWIPGRWYRVLDEHGNLWCETSDPNEALAAAKQKGTSIKRLWRYSKDEWRDYEADTDSMG